MNIQFISPIEATSPGLFESFEKTFLEQGHHIVSDPQQASVFFFDSHSGYLPYDNEVLYQVTKSKKPVAYFDAFDYHTDSSKHWFGFNNWEALKKLHEHNPQGWSSFLLQASARNKPFIYFMRKMQTNADYGKFVFPLELCQYPSHDFPLTTKEELYSRPYDICFIGAKSPRRENMVYSLFTDFRLKVKHIFTEERISHRQWLNEHRTAKLFLEADGGGLGSERPYQLMPIAPMLKQNNLQLIVNDFEDGIDGIKVGDESGKATAHDRQKIIDIINHKDWLYSIYLAGNEKLKKYFSWEYRANYVLKIIQQQIELQNNRELYESYFGYN